MMSSDDLFNSLAADLFMERLQANQFRSHNKHIIDYLPERERRLLFSALMDQAQVSKPVRIRDEASKSLRFIETPAFDLLPFLVVGDAEVQEVAARWGDNAGSEGFASSLRDYFAAGVDDRIRLLVVFTPAGNETQKSAQDLAVDAHLLGLPLLCERLAEHYGFVDDRRIHTIVDTYLDYRPQESWEETLRRLTAFLDAISEEHTPDNWGRHLPALGCFLPDHSPSYADGKLPVDLPKSAKEKRVGADSRLQSNAALKADIVDAFENSLIDTEQKIRDDFEPQSAEAILEQGPEGLASVDVGQLHRKVKTRRNNGFDWEHVRVAGAAHFHRLAGKDSSHILLVAAPGEFEVTVELEQAFDDSQEHIHLLQWHKNRNAPRPAPWPPTLVQGDKQVRFSISPDSDFEVYRAAVTAGKQSYQKYRSDFFIVIYKTELPVVAWENGLELSLEYQAWVREVTQNASFKTFSVAGEIEQCAISYAQTELRDASDERPESAEFDVSVDSVRWGVLHGEKLPLRICWVEHVSVESGATYELLELAAYQQKSRDASTRLMAAFRRDSESSYLAALTDVTRDPGGFWNVEIASSIRLQVRAWNDHGQENAVAALLAHPEARIIHRAANGELTPTKYGEAFEQSNQRFCELRAGLFEKLREVTPCRRGGVDGPTDAVQLMLTDLLSLRSLIEDYYQAWLDAVLAVTAEEAKFGAIHDALLQTDLLVNTGASGRIERLTVLPTHPWLLRALLSFQWVYTTALDEALESGKLAEIVTEFEMRQLMPQRIVEDWFYGSPSERFRAEDATPFHLDFLAAQQYRQSANLDYVARVVRNKIKRYLEMHGHLQDARRTLRIGFVNPGSGGPLFEGIRLWLEGSVPRSAAAYQEWFDQTPNIEVILFEKTGELFEPVGAAFDAFFREHLDTASSRLLDQAMLSKLRYGKRDTMHPESDEDYVHICFAAGLIDPDDYSAQEGQIDYGWDGCFAGGLMSTSLRRTIADHSGNHRISERGLWVSPLRDPQRQGLAGVLMLMRGARGGMVDPGRGLYWRVRLPTLDALEPMYQHSDWVVHLDRELGLELFREFGERGPRIIEYSDQEDPHSPGFDIITLTRHAAPYLEQLDSVLHFANLVAHESGSATTTAANKLLDDINILSGSWALDFLAGNVTQNRYANRLKGNVGSALVFRWLRRVEEAALAKKYGKEVVSVYVSLEELIRATPAAKLPLKDGLVQRYSNENEDGQETNWCDDLLVFYLTPAREGQSYKIFGRIIEVKFGSSAERRRDRGVEQVRRTYDMLEKHLAGGNDSLEAPFRHRQLSLLIKSQLDQAVSSGILAKERYHALNLSVLSAHLASGNYEVDYIVSEGNRHRKGDVFLLSTLDKSAPLVHESQPRIESHGGVRVITIERDLLRWLAFSEEVALPLGAGGAETLPDIGRAGASLGDYLRHASRDDMHPGLGEERSEAGIHVHMSVSSQSKTQPLPSEENSRELLADGGSPAVIEPTNDAEAAATAITELDEQKGDLTGAEPTRTSLHEASATPLKVVAPDVARLQTIIERLQQVFKGHGIDVEAPPSTQEVEFGPRLIRVYVRLMANQTINSVRKRSEDIARVVGTSAPDIHIMNVTARRAIALDLPIPEMGYQVDFEDLRRHPSFEAARRELALGFCAGVHITGKPHWVDLAEMPHALVAGTTGSGKTVFLRSVILALVLAHAPGELELRLSSSKPMDFKIFTQLPHASRYEMAENPQDTLQLVRDLVTMMDDRIRILSDAFCDNLGQYNADPDVRQKLPRVVAVIDEYAETVLSFQEKSDRRAFEDGVSRLAQKARAAGIHLILCMQRPDGSVLQGAVKSNILHRFALKLPQNHDSRVILDEPGAETLLGKGDMLYKDASGNVHRLQVPYLDGPVLKALVRQLCT